MGSSRDEESLFGSGRVRVVERGRRHVKFIDSCGRFDLVCGFVSWTSPLSLLVLLGSLGGSLRGSLRGIGDDSVCGGGCLRVWRAGAMARALGGG